MRRPQSLYARLALAVSMATAVGVISLSLWTSYQQAGKLLQSRLHEAQVMVDNFAQSVAHAMVVEDYAGLEEFLTRAVLLARVDKIVAVDNQGRVLSTVTRGANRSVELSYDMTPLQPPATAQQFHRIDKNKLVLWEPIEAGSLLGWLQVTFSLEDVSEMKAAIWQQDIMVGFIWLLGTCLLVILVLRPTANAIHQLAAFAHALPSRKGATIPVDRSVLELSELGDALNHASGELNRIEQELLEMNRTLEARVEAELAKSREKDSLLLQQARYQTMGELLVNIAHHWRQPLNAIGASMQECACKISAGEVAPQEAPEKIHEIMLILQQLSRSIEGFRQLCRPADPQDSLFLPSVAIAQAIRLVRDGYLQMGIQLELIIISEQPLRGSTQDMVQCIINVLSNARDAIAANRVIEGQIRIMIAATPPGHLQITVADNGGGIPGQLLTTLFDPYVTSKFRAQGVGLGLFVVRQIIEQRFNGTVAARNTETGAELTIDIPLSQGACP